MFIQDTNNFIYLDFNIDNIKEKLDPGIYKLHAGKQLIFEKVDFDNLPEILGEEHKRIKNKVVKREASALFVGKSGFGKTLLTKHIAKEFAKKYPVILVERVKVDILKNISYKFDKAVFLFDEFEKNFLYLKDPENFQVEDFEVSQEALLSFFDGVAKKHIFLLTANEREKISKYIFNRPGRIRYVFNFEELNEDIFKEFGFSDDDIELLKEIENANFKFSFDLLKYLKEEKEAGFDIEESLKDIGIDIELLKILKDYEPINFYEKGKEKYKLKDVTYTITDNSLKVYYVDEDGDKDFMFLNYPNYKFKKDILEISSGVYTLRFKRRNDVKG